MSRLSVYKCNEFTDYLFECVGCGISHSFKIFENDIARGWTFNGDLEKPTFTPSLLVRFPYGKDQKEVVCHSFVTDGRIQYLNDCTHEQAGKTIEL